MTVVPTLCAGSSLRLIADRFSEHQLLYVPDAAPPLAHSSTGFDAFLEQHAPLPISDEHPGTTSWYKSLVLDPDTRPLAYAHLEQQLPDLPLCAAGNGLILHDPVIWAFFGRNPEGHTALRGRPEHLDAVGASGTWHWQASGTKRWRVRADCEGSWPAGSQPSCGEYMNIDCAAGSLFMINTALYYHETELPPQQAPSVSFAKEFYLAENQAVCSQLSLPTVSTTMHMSCSVCEWCGTATGLSRILGGSVRAAASECECLCCSVRRQARRLFRRGWHEAITLARKSQIQMQMQVAYSILLLGAANGRRTKRSTNKNQMSRLIALATHAFDGCSIKLLPIQFDDVSKLPLTISNGYCELPRAPINEIGTEISFNCTVRQLHEMMIQSLFNYTNKS